jgi:hypothetical protein
MSFSYSGIVAWLDNALGAVLGHKKQVLMAITGVIVIAASATGYMFYQSHVQTQAHKAFIEALRYFDAPVKPGQTVITESVIEFGSDEDKWKKVEEVFRTGYDSYKRSGLSSMFRCYQAEALTHLKKHDEAIQMLAAAIKAMPSEQLKDFYKLKLALLRLDAAQPEVAKEGFAELKKIAETSTNLANEASLYYMGLYFWSQKDYTQAKNYWQQLMVKYGMKEGKDQSGFSELAREKLKLISAEW